MKEKIIITVLLVLLMWFGITIIRLENYHYAVQVGICNEFDGFENSLEREQCLNTVETRTNPIFHLLYGLKIL